MNCTLWKIVAVVALVMMVVFAAEDVALRADRARVERQKPELLWHCVGCEQSVDLSEGYTVTSGPRRECVCMACALEHWSLYGFERDNVGFRDWVRSLEEARVPSRSPAARYPRTCSSCQIEFSAPIGRCPQCHRPVCGDCSSGGYRCPRCLYGEK